MLTHHNIANNGFSVGENQRLDETDRICLPVPLFHCFGCVLGVLAAVGHGSGLVILETFDPVPVMAAVEQEYCTALCGVPTMFIAVLEHKLFSTFRFDSLRTVILAGSPCPLPVMRKVMERMCMAQITVCYGLTEASPMISQTRTDDDLRRRTETVGRPLAGVEVRIVDPETGEPLAAGSQGEVCCCAYNVIRGFRRRVSDDGQRQGAKRQPGEAGRVAVSECVIDRVPEAGLALRQVTNDVGKLGKYERLAGEFARVEAAGHGKDHRAADDSGASAGENRRRIDLIEGELGKQDRKGGQLL